MTSTRSEKCRNPFPTVDIIIEIRRPDGRQGIVLIKRKNPPPGWALPGGFVRPRESPAAAVARVLWVKARLEAAHTAQLATFGEPGRDPRGWVVSVAHYALVPHDRLPPDLATRTDTTLARVTLADGAPHGGPASASGPDGELVLAFDHAEIIGRAIDRIRGRLWYAPVALQLMPAEFTLLDLQAAYEAVLGRRIDKNSLRRRILASGLVAPVGRRREGLRARPAELFRRERTSRDP